MSPEHIFEKKEIEINDRVGHVRQSSVLPHERRRDDAHLSRAGEAAGQRDCFAGHPCGEAYQAVS